MSNLIYLFAALAVIWIGIWLYTYYLSQRLRELRREVDNLVRRRDG